ncbi:major facilitator superfamily domain-containing protein [Lipomyces kononenkoae]|uniref:Major facilitator superfamily domain-containing protein n=1 Tax=Lipomyces kononenkoae TaxID=34357 RepID=A0ACC3SY03_LIPKO
MTPLDPPSIDTRSSTNDDEKHHQLREFDSQTDLSHSTTGIDNTEVEAGRRHKEDKHYDGHDLELGLITIDTAPPALSLEPATSVVLDAIDSHVIDTADQEEYAAHSKSKTKPNRRIPIGFLHRICATKELENPYEYSENVKRLLVFIFAFAGMIPAMGSAVFYPAVNTIAADFHTNLTIINLSVGFYMFSMGLFPLWWSYLSESLGRRGTYIISFALFTVFNIGCARANSIVMLVIFRVLAGGAAASSQTVGAGAIGDIYVPTERGRANGYFYLGPLCGPMVAPIFAGALNDRWGWRATQYFLIIIGGVTLLMILFLLPETLRPQILPLKLQEMRDAEQKNNRVRYYARETSDFVFSPFKSFALLKYPTFVYAIFYNSFGYGGLYMMNNTIPDVFAMPPYNFSSIITGLLYLPNGFGYVLGSLVGGRWSDRILQRAVKKNNGKMVPEARLAENMLTAGVIVCAGMILFGWTAAKHLFWFVPTIGTFLFGFGSLIIFTSTLTFLVDSMPHRRSAAVSINTFVRCMFAAVASFVTVPLNNAIKSGWLFTILTIIGLIFLALQVYVKKKAPEWRAKMNAELD